MDELVELPSRLDEKGPWRGRRLDSIGDVDGVTCDDGDGCGGAGGPPLSHDLRWLWWYGRENGA